ncbi:Membrane protein containing HD superfamily hydrolase domain, YQFF ortholog [hydrothermal vent metagenome]|uniref:Membrane protein containing HD superfamily hydrolase domain, YQFF ortholog n=1 Tax=hydrothermal vent metagenome TaxID=652676 RepID=A0A3B1E804_9ZZZZ
MARENGKTSGSKNGTRRSNKRGRGARSVEQRLFARVLELSRSRSVTWGAVVTLCFGLITGLLAAWTRDQPLMGVGQVATETRTVRVSFRVEDLEQTESAREQARQQATPIFLADEAWLGELRSSIENLPRTLAHVETLEDVDEGIRQQFRLTTEGLLAVQGQAQDGEPTPEYLHRIDRLWRAFERTPILDAQTWQRTSQGLSAQLELRGTGQGSIAVHRDRALSAEDVASLQARLEELCAQAGIDSPLRQVIVSRLSVNAKPTYRLDTAATAAAQDAAAAAVEPVVSDWPAGAVIFTRGDVLTPAQIDLWKAELSHFRGEAARWRVWLGTLSVITAATAIGAGAALYAALFCTRIRKKVSRMVWIASLLVGALAVACLASVAMPGALTVTAVMPTVFVAAILVIAYDQRISLALSSLHAVLVCMALDQPIGMFGLILAGVAVAVWQLREIRARDTLIRMGVATGIALAVATVLVLSIERPIVEAAIRETLWDALWAGLGGVAVGAIVLFLLPVIERAFDITTGMTLIELRDPKQELLKELQQRAPGSYNHSLNVATIGEAAAAAIGADTLLTYAGALYHDIGKMNKPEYFVENQTGGINRHDKLSPAMSLLVIVGHVKDGMEMAREYGLPKSLQQFIEGHHGTTLVEYFYHRAKKQAEADNQGDGPSEIEYRYPGPKPRSKEVAILMIADAVESASRTLSEPTPARIDQLVREIANKRLLDGQFDECDLTLRELHDIVESVSKSLASSYHGRVVYPAGGESKTGEAGQAEAKTAAGG